MYELTRMEPTTGTQTFPASGKVATINLYYGLEASTDTMTKDTPYINVEKRFTGITEQQIPDGFKICIGSHTLTKNGFNPATSPRRGTISFSAGNWTAWMWEPIESPRRVRQYPATSLER